LFGCWEIEFFTCLSSNESMCSLLIFIFFLTFLCLLWTISSISGCTFLLLALCEAAFDAFVFYSLSIGSPYERLIKNI
jgi:hypothetical protein